MTKCYQSFPFLFVKKKKSKKSSKFENPYQKPFHNPFLAEHDSPVLANIIDPDQLASKKPTDLDLHCLPFSM